MDGPRCADNQPWGPNRWWVDAPLFTNKSRQWRLGVPVYQFSAAKTVDRHIDCLGFVLMGRPRRKNLTSTDAKTSPLSVSLQALIKLEDSFPR